VKVILDKLAATNRTQAAMLAAELGWPPSRTPAKV
jgi:DNA-binding NarL/FixJ family response regulator